MVGVSLGTTTIHHARRFAPVRLPPAPPVAEAIARTRADRDRSLDAIRALALVLVVLGHGIAGVVGWPDEGGVVVATTLAIYPWAAWATWLLQIMPLFFVAGGAVNARSWRASSAPWPAWVWRRVARLLRPVWVYLVVMAPVCGAVSLAVDPRVAGPLLVLATQLLWFVGVYVMVTALTPWAVAAHDRHPWLTPALLVLATAAVDLVRLGLDGPAAVGLLNFVLVWWLAAQWGILLADGDLVGRRAAGVALGALVANLLLTELGPYPRSMVGLPGESFSNMAPPSLVLAMHATVLAGLVAVGRPALARLTGRPAVWRATVAVNLTAMTLYLWHLPMLVLLVAGQHALGVDRPIRWVDGQPTPGPSFWLWTPLYLAAFALLVAAIVRLMWPFEHRPLPLWDRGRATRLEAATPGRRAASALGALVIGVGALALSATGLEGFPTRVAQYAGIPINSAAAIGFMALGGWLVRSAGSENGNRVLP